jgi:hypothetical protein
MDVPTILKKGRGVNLLHNGYRYSKDKKNTVGVQYRSCPGRAHTTGNDEVQLLKSTDHDHEPDMEAALSAKMKSDLCERAADNPTTNERSVQPVHVFRCTTPGR